MGLQTELFSFAYIPAWYEQLYELSQIAMPEPWRFKAPRFKTQNEETPILERYIQQVFRKQAIDYNYAPDQASRARYSASAARSPASIPGC